MTVPHIKPFKGVVYNKKKVGSLASVVAPPYDVISKKQQEDLYRKSPHNIVRLELGKIMAGDDAGDNRYTRAARYFESWLKDRVLVRDDKEAFYVYSQSYKDCGKKIERLGFFALMGLDTGKGRKVLPHENTLLAPKLDRLDVMRNVRANLSPIYVLYDDTGSRVTAIIKRLCARSRPFMDIHFEGIRNRAWRLDDHKAIKAIGRIMDDKDIFIADGHHRYEVARMYAQELCGGASKKNVSEGIKASAKNVMLYLVAADEKILTVLPAHRLVKDMGPLSKDEIAPMLSEHFIIRKVKGLKSVMAQLKELKDKHVFGLYLGQKKFYVLILKDLKASDAAVKDKPLDWKRLDVVILHRFILSHILGIKDTDENIEFVKSPEETAAMVDKGDFKAAFFLNATKVSEIKRIARLGEKMPRKATYFFPKPITGVVIYKH